MTMNRRKKVVRRLSGRSYIYGFALQERDMGFKTPGSAGEVAQRRAATVASPEDYPYLLEIARKLPGSGYDSAAEFAWGLDLILDGLDRLRHAEAEPRVTTTSRE
jgi:hypothetical protein